MCLKTSALHQLDGIVLLTVRHHSAGLVSRPVKLNVKARLALVHGDAACLAMTVTAMETTSVLQPKIDLQPIHSRVWGGEGARAKLHQRLLVSGLQTIVKRSMGCVNANLVSLDLCASTANVLMAALAMANVPHSALPSEHRAHSTRAVSVTMDSVARTALNACQTGAATTMAFWRLVLVFAKLLGTGNTVKLKAVRKTVAQTVARAFARKQLGNARFGCHLGRQGTSPRAVPRRVFAMLVSEEVSAVNSKSSSTSSRLETVLSVKSEMSPARLDALESAKLSVTTST